MTLVDVSRRRWRAQFEVRDDVDVDRVVIDEVWRSNDYRIDDARGLSGTVLDLGANIGAFTVLAARAGASRVVSLEPEAANYALLTANVARNRVSDMATLLRMALGGHERATVHMVGTGGGAIAQPVESGMYGDSDAVPTVTLASLLDEYGPVSMLKCDIEGGEFAAFAALPVDMLAQVERIAMEWHAPQGGEHLRYLVGDEFGPLVTKLADAGRVETFGHPSRGGLLHWKRY